MTTSDFLSALRTQVPEAGPVIDGALKGPDDELLLHLIVADLMRFAQDRFEQGDWATLDNLLRVVERGLLDGDEAVENAVAVSFVENTGTWDPATKPFVASWPEGLREEARRQQRSS